MKFYITHFRNYYDFYEKEWNVAIRDSDEFFISLENFMSWDASTKSFIGYYVVSSIPVSILHLEDKRVLYKRPGEIIIDFEYPESIKEISVDNFLNHFVLGYHYVTPKFFTKFKMCEELLDSICYGLSEAKIQLC